MLITQQVEVSQPIDSVWTFFGDIRRLRRAFLEQTSPIKLVMIALRAM